MEAGDTFVFDESAVSGKYERELAAAEKFDILDEPLSCEFLHLWIEVEAEETTEAIFVCAVDHIMPFLLNVYSCAQSWTEVDVNVNQIEKYSGENCKKSLR